MNLKFNAVFIGLALLLFGLQAENFARTIKLRGQIAPGCATTSSLKYADIYADGNIAVMGSYNCRGAFIFDISNPNAPVLRNWYNPGANQQFLEAIVVGNRGYFGSGNGGGVHIVDLTNPASPVLLGIVNSTNGNGHNSIHEMNVFTQNGQTLLLENFNGTSNKTLKIINVTNPAAPVFVRDIIPTEPQWVHAVHIRGNRMFTSGWGNSTSRGRTEIYNIANITTTAPTLLGFVEDSTSVTAGNAMHSSWSSEDGNYLYSCRETTASNSANPADLRVYDISNPAQPVMVKKISMNNLGINAVSPHNPVVMGNKLYISWYQAGTQIFDISDPTNPVKIGEYDTYPQEYVPQDFAGDLTDEPWDIICGSSATQNLLPTSYAGNWAVFPFLGEDKVLLGDLSTGLYIVDVTLKNQISDFDGDKKTDISVFSPTSGNWTIEKSSDNSSSTVNFGLSGDKIVSGDYDGDGNADLAIFRPSTGTWWIRRSTNPSNFLSINFGISTDIPVPGDYDGDGKTDVAVFRPSNGVWYIQQSTGGVKILSWGLSTDIPFNGDYDGDGKADLGIYRNGIWYILRSSNGSALITQFGIATDKPVVGDFDGDDRADIAVYRPSEGNWYVMRSANNSFFINRFGTAEDMPIPADYDGDGKSDIAVFRPSENVWYRLNSSNGAFSWKVFGQNGDIPSPVSAQP
jgi:hypothetical protein